MHVFFVYNLSSNLAIFAYFSNFGLFSGFLHIPEFVYDAVEICVWLCYFFFFVLNYYCIKLSCSEKKPTF